VLKTALSAGGAKGESPERAPGFSFWRLDSEAERLPLAWIWRKASLEPFAALKRAAGVFPLRWGRTAFKRAMLHFYQMRIL